MSVMMLDTKHYQYIADSLYSTIYGTGITEYYRSREQFSTYDCATQEKQIMDFVNGLMINNLKAYNTRYPAHSVDQSALELISTPKTRLGGFNPEQYLKALQSVEYQCSDLPWWDEIEIGIKLEKLIDDAKDAVINRVPEYQKAKWSIE